MQIEEQTKSCLEITQGSEVFEIFLAVLSTAFQVRRPQEHLLYLGFPPGFPGLMALAADGIAIAGVNMNDTEPNALDFLNELENPFAGVAFDPKGRTKIDWGVTAPPETFIIDKDGKVAFRFIGPLVGTAYEKRFLPALEKVLSAQ